MDRRAIAIVSGLPRSGTSMMMRMLHKGGMDVLTDELREADGDNPKGYYEFERVKQLKQDTSWIPDAEGRVVKIISQLLQYLPSDHNYKVIFMRRRMEEVLASQKKMLVRRGEETDRVADAKLAALFQTHLEHVQRWLDAQPNLDVIYVSYNQILEGPRREVGRIIAFLEEDLDPDAMASVVDPKLYRQRT